MDKIYKIFFLLTVTSLILFVVIFIQDRNFQNNPLSNKLLAQIAQKEKRIHQRIKQRYNESIDFPIIIEDELPNNLFGLAGYNNGKIILYLNKKRFQENENYMINYVLPHEYAHGMMFYFGDFTRENGGHTQEWENICTYLSERKCNRFVDKNDILIEKLGGIY